MLGDIFDVLIDFEVKFQREFYVGMFHNSFVVNILTSLVIPSEQRRFLPVNRSVNRLWHVSVSLFITKIYVDTATGVSPANDRRLQIMSPYAGLGKMFFDKFIRYFLLKVRNSESVIYLLGVAVMMGLRGFVGNIDRFL
jgi:hypothetical protein